jgi:subtilisin family serine protease
VGETTYDIGNRLELQPVGDTNVRSTASLIAALALLPLAHGQTLLAKPKMKTGPMNEIVSGQIRVKLRPADIATLEGIRPGRVATSFEKQLVPNGQFQNRIGESEWTIWTIPMVSDPVTLAAQVKANKRVLHAEPVNKIYALLTEPNDPDWHYQETSEEFVLNFGEDDLSFRRLWATEDVLAWEGWNIWPNTWYTSITKPLDTPTIAVIDTGCDLDHPDFRNAGGAGTDVSQGGQLIKAKCKQFVNGVIAVPGNADDTNGHGTHVAGIAFAAGNNGGYLGKGMVGIGYNSKGMILRVFDETGNGTDNDAAAALYYAADNGADIINLSLGTRNFSQLFQDAVTYAFQKGVLVVAAANEDGGGGGEIGPIYPAACSGTLCVTANGPEAYTAAGTYAGTGAYVDIAAPGGDAITDFSVPFIILQFVYSTAPRGEVALNQPGATTPAFWHNYAYLLGTSMACPHVSGAAGLFYGKYNLRRGNWNNVRAYRALERSAGAVYSGPNGGWEPTQGYGSLDVFSLVQELNARNATVGAVEGIVYLGGTAIGNVSVTATNVATNQVFNTTTRSDGGYRFDALQAGIYKVRAAPFGRVREKRANVIVGSDKTGVDLWAKFTGDDFDATPPTIDHLNVSSTSETVVNVDHWVYDVNTTIDKMTFRIGTTAGAADVLGDTEIVQDGPTFTLTTPVRDPLKTYYLRATYENGDGDLSIRTVPFAMTLVSNAEFVSQTAPNTVAAGSTFSATVTMKNTSNYTWKPTKSVGVDLKSQNPSETTRWGITNVYLPTGSSIAPGQNATFTFNCVAPATPGNYNFQWRMNRSVSKTGEFGQFTTNKVITVN